MPAVRCLLAAWHGIGWHDGHFEAGCGVAHQGYRLCTHCALVMHACSHEEQSYLVWTSYMT